MLFIPSGKVLELHGFFFVRNLLKAFRSLFFITLILFFGMAQGAGLCSQIFTSSVFVGVSESVLRNKFVTSRDLHEYRYQLHKDFAAKVDSLTSNQHWVDLGAGKANAQIDFLRERDASSRPLMTAVAYKLDRWFSAPKFSGRLQIKEGAFELQETAQWVKADLITDFFGVLSYSKDMQTSLQKTLNLLKVGGELYIYSTQWSTSIRVHDKSYNLGDFLSLFPGLRVEGQFGTLKITKLDENIQVPEMVLMKFKEDMPPSRTFTVP